MTQCDVCGRAVFKRDATTFPKNSVVICRRRECQTYADRAKMRYYELGNDGVSEVLP